jgi:hypothetical protein
MNRRIRVTQISSEMVGPQVWRHDAFRSHDALDGTYEATMASAGGELTIVRVGIELTSQGVVADGEVSVAGDTVFRRRWLTDVG